MVRPGRCSERRDLHPARSVGGDASNAWAVGDHGVILRWDGVTWRRESSGIQCHLKVIWGAAADDIWAGADTHSCPDRPVDTSDPVHHWDGVAWRTVDSPPMSEIHGIWGTDGANVWAVGAHWGDTIAARWDGVRWQDQGNQRPFPYGDIRDIWGWGADAVWVYQDNRTAQWDGTGWHWPAHHPEHPRESVDLTAMWGASPADVWLVGRRGDIFHWNGAAWQLHTQDQLYAGLVIGGAAADDVYVAG
jgi:hypothetical protein